MKATKIDGFRRSGLFVIGLLLVSVAGLFAQSTSNSIPVVTLQATVPKATWTGGAGVFTVFRAGDTNLTLNVYCCISGTASNGVDYQSIGAFVQLPGGVTSNSVVIKPIDHGQTNIETVTLDLCPSPLMIPVNYTIGSPSSATVYITPATNTNIPPSVNMVSPDNGAVYYTPTDIILLARAGDLDGTVTNVEFRAGTNDLGRGVQLVLDPPGVNGVVGPVYFFNWQNVPTNQYALAAVATDNNGASTTSAPVKISVRAGQSPTNVPPVVRIVSPPNGSVFRAPANLHLFAHAEDSDGTITSVEFFAAGASLGFGSQAKAVPPPLPAGPLEPPILISVLSNYWELVWTNAPLGTNIAMTAQATDNGGATTLSAPVTITVLPSPPPPTNRPAIVNIIATDPVAIEGTNAWVWPGETNASPSWAAWPAAVCQWFTNFGPKTASFTVHRWGDLSNALTVPYNIGGTATNGIDYAAIPGSVTIPSGEPSAPITILPIDDGPPDLTKTVILALTPSTNSPADYLLGFPRRAAAIILDRGGPFPGPEMLSDRCFHLVTSGPDAAWFSVEYSTNLTTWTPICTNQVVNGSIDFVDSDTQTDQARYYRVIPATSPPLQSP